MSKETIADLIRKVYNTQALGIKAPTGQQEGVDADGGYLVTEPVLEAILSSMRQSSIFYSQAAKLQTESYGGKLPYVVESDRTETDSVLKAFWVGEGNEKTSDKLAFGLKTCKLHKLVAMMYFTDELLEDSNLLESFCDEFVAKTLSWYVDAAILHGDSATSMYGIFTSGASVQVSVADPLDEATLLNFVKALAPAASKNAKWYMSKENYNDILDITFSNSQAFKFVNGETLLFGYPVEVVEQMKYPYDIFLGDATRYAVVEKGGIAKAVNISLKYDADEKAIRWVLRLNGGPFGQVYDLEDGTEVGDYVLPEYSPIHNSSSSSSSSSTEAMTTSSSSDSSESSLSSGV